VAASVAQGVARIDPRARIQPRDQSVFSVDVERMHFFDPDSGDAISPAVPATTTTTLTSPAPSAAAPA
jgi:hypothetical protein